MVVLQIAQIAKQMNTPVHFNPNPNPNPNRASATHTTHLS